MKWQKFPFWAKVFRNVILISSAMILTIFWRLGANAYADDISFIDSQMLETASWVSENIEEGSLIAAHDIGALGYITEGNILDLAGLVSPEVIPIIRDESALESYMNKNSVEYLITFEDWYPELTHSRGIIYQSADIILGNSYKAGMGVFQWR